MHFRIAAPESSFDSASGRELVERTMTQGKKYPTDPLEELSRVSSLLCHFGPPCLLD